MVVLSNLMRVGNKQLVSSIYYYSMAGHLTDLYDRDREPQKRHSNPPHPSLVTVGAAIELVDNYSEDVIRK